MDHTETTFEQPILDTARLTLEPIVEGHAQELWELFRDPELHHFVPFEPQTLEKQREQCVLWSKRRSPDGKELWLNWAGREKSTGRIAAHFQVGSKDDGVATIGYLVARPAQGQGLATEGLTAVFTFLKNTLSVREVKAWSDTRNVASHRLAKKLGMVQVGFIKDADFFKGSASDEFIFSKTFEIQPVWQPTLAGDLISLRPLVEDDFESLYTVASDPMIWEQHPVRDRHKREQFYFYFRSGIESKGALVILDNKTRKMIGSSRFTGFDAERSCIEIGYTFISRAYWGNGHNRELKGLMLNHAFKHVNTAHFYVGETNFRSQKAMEKIGAIEINRIETTQPEGYTRTSVIYQIKKADWVPSLGLPIPQPQSSPRVE